MDKKNLKYVILIAIFILASIGAYFIIEAVNKKDGLQYDEFLKNYKVNEYIATYVSDEDMAKIYLKDYTHTMYYNVEEAYKLLDEDYRNAKFPTLNSYINYVNSLPFTKYELTKYYRKVENGYVIFGVYDNNGNIFIFKTSGVMQYSVYLDEDTVEIR